jgi:hypothetical protein
MQWWFVDDLKAAYEATVIKIPNTPKNFNLLRKNSNHRVKMKRKKLILEMQLQSLGRV